MFERCIALKENLVGSNIRECFLFHKWICDSHLYSKIYDTKDINYKYGIEIYKIKRCFFCKKEKYILIKKEKFVFESDMGKRKSDIKLGLFKEK